MDVTVTGRNIDISERLREVTIDKVGRLSRFLDGMERAEVKFSEERNPRITDSELCEVTLEGHGHHIRAKGAAADAFVALDRAAEKAEHQLHKLKTRLVRRHHGGRSGSVHSPEESMDAMADTDHDDDEGVRIVRTKRFAFKPMTPVEAALQMDLVGHDFYFFSNAETGRAAVVYQRRDGDIGLIDEAG